MLSLTLIIYTTVDIVTFMINLKRLFRRKAEVNHPLTDEDREKALEIRRQNSRIINLEKQLESQQRLISLENDIKSLKGIASGEEDAFLKLVTPFLMKAFNNPAPEGFNVSPIGYPSVSPSQNVEHARNHNIAQEIVKKVPSQYIDMVLNFSDEDLIDIKKNLSSLRVKA